MDERCRKNKAEKGKNTEHTDSKLQSKVKRLFQTAVFFRSVIVGGNRLEALTDAESDTEQGVHDTGNNAHRGDRGVSVWSGHQV